MSFEPSYVGLKTGHEINLVCYVLARELREGDFRELIEMGSQIVYRP